MSFPYLVNEIDFESRFCQLEKFLGRYKHLWQPIQLASYPNPLEKIPKEWVDYIKESSLTDLYLLSNAKCTGVGIPVNTPRSLIDLIDEIREITEFPNYFHDQTLVKSDSIYDQQINGLHIKKAHELRNLGPLAKDFSDALIAQHLVELGGGKGYLSLAASSCKASQVVIDQMGDLLFKCKGYFERWHRNKNIQCVEMKIENCDFQQPCGVGKESLLVGLHLCGNLSNILLQSCVKEKNLGLISLGCCYHKLSLKEQNISGRCRFELGTSEFRLALAPYHYRTFFSFQNNVIKNLYRFVLYDLYAKIENKVPTMKRLNRYDYPHQAKTFDFVGFLDQNEKNIDFSIPLGELKKHFTLEVEDKAREMEIYEYTRRFFSRAIEVYIILDRLMYLQDAGMEVNLVQLFDSRISPRNLGIIAKF